MHSSVDVILCILCMRDFPVCLFNPAFRGCQNPINGLLLSICLSVCSKVQTCIWPSGFHCHSLSLASVKSRLVLPSWYRPTRVVLDKGPLNVMCVLSICSHCRGQQYLINSACVSFFWGCQKSALIAILKTPSGSISFSS